jgi:hypothetical protein
MSNKNAFHEDDTRIHPVGQKRNEKIIKKYKFHKYQNLKNNTEETGKNMLTRLLLAGLKKRHLKY